MMLKFILSTCVLTTLLICSINLTEAGKTNFDHKIKKQNQKHLDKHNKKSKKKKTINTQDEISFFLFLTTYMSYINTNESFNAEEENSDKTKNKLTD